MKNGHVEIVCVLDASGSMESTKASAINGFNDLVEEQRQQPGSCSMTLVTFNNAWERKYLAEPLANIAPLTDASYRPGGGTALYDALGHTIETVGEVAAKSGAQVVFVIITDGGENASQDYRRQDIVKLTAEKEVSGWRFVYIGANQDAFSEALNLGLQHAASANYAANAAGTATAYAVSSSAVGAMRAMAAKPKREQDEEWAKLMGVVSKG
jgi:Mg-chelatase subunit ChlD